jgi:hypothetical protein
MTKLTPEEVHKRWLEMPSGYRYTYRQIIRYHQMMRLLLRTMVGVMIFVQIWLIVWAID